MAKKQNRGGPGRPRTLSLPELGAMVEALAEEVRHERAVLALKERRLAKIRKSFLAITKLLRPESAAAADVETEVVSRRRVAPKGVLRDLVMRAMADGRERGPAEMLKLAKKAGYESPATDASQSVMTRQLVTDLVKEKLLKRLGKGRYVKA